MSQKEEISLERYLITKIPIVNNRFRVGDVLSLLEKKGTFYDTVEYIYVNNLRGKLVGAVNIRELFNNSKDTLISRLMEKNIVAVSLQMEIERIADISLKHHLTQIPVVKSGKLLGVISSRRIFSIINRSLKEDIFHFAGIHKSHLEFENSLEIPVFKAVTTRLSWLFVGLIGSIFMALYMGLFEQTLAKHIIIAAFVPAVVYLSDALGTQIQTIFVRDLAILGKQLKFRQYMLKHLIVSLSISTIISLTLFFFILLLWRLPIIAFAISLASFSTLLFTGFTAIIITLMIKKFKFDPAIGSGPIATIISDATSIIIYFLIVIWFV